MSFLSDCMLASRILSHLSLILQVYFFIRIAWHIRSLNVAYYSCVLSITICAIIQNLLAVSNITGSSLSSFWTYMVFCNVTIYSEVATMIHIAIIRLIAVSPDSKMVEKTESAKFTFVLITIAWLLGVFGVSLEPFIWDVSYSNTTGVVYNTSQTFAICEQIYVFGGVTGAVVLYALIIVKLQKRGRQVAAATNTTKQTGKKSDKLGIRIAIQAFLIGIFLIIFRTTVIIKPFVDAQDVATSLGIRVIFMWFHYTSTPVICVCVSKQMRELLFCKGKHSVRVVRGSVNTVSTIA